MNKSTIEVDFKSIQFANKGYMVRCKVDTEWFLEYMFPEKAPSFWEHGMIYSWEKSGSVPDLTVLSEEELFQFTLVQEFSETEKMLAVQKYVLENLEFLKTTNELVFRDLVY